MSWGLWQRRFGGDRAVLNQTIHLDGQPYTVIGILPEWFAYPNASTQLWTSIRRYTPVRRMSSLAVHNYAAIGRLRPGITAAQGVADLSAISRRLHDRNLDSPWVFEAVNDRPLLEDMVGDIKRSLYVLLAATGCLLLIACLNVANLLVARTAARRQELAIRAALGGGWLRLMREHMLESFILSIAGGGIGLALAYGAVAWLLHTRQNMARAGDIRIDGAVAGFTVAVIAVCALFAGLISASGAHNRRILASLHEGLRTQSAGTARARLRKCLLAAEVGITVVLLFTGGLLLKSYERLRSADLGCLTKNVLTMRLNLLSERYRQDPALLNFFATLLPRVRALPGVRGAGFARAVPGQGYWYNGSFTIVEHPPLPLGQEQDAINRWADPGYFAAMGIPILRGHSFDPGRTLDKANQVVISAEFARQFFPGEDPIGKHLRFGTFVLEIIGVVGDTRYAIGAEPKPIMYRSILSGWYNEGVLVVRSGRNVQQLALPVQRIIQSIDHDLPVSDVLTMDQLIGKSTLDQSFDATLITGFAVLSLLLAAAGLFGVLSYVVAQRSSEIGIRIALGAQREQVLRLMLAEGMRPALIGLIFGLAASAAVTRAIKSMLYGTQPLDPPVFAAAAGLLLAVAALACIVPAWRASRLDPMQALRTE